MKLLDAFKKKTAKPEKAKIVKEEVEKQFKTVQSTLERSKRSLIIRPVVTEKASALALNKSYVFLVNNKANKIEIKKAIKELYNVNPVSVNIIRKAGKAVRYGRTQGRTKEEKKAIVTLKSGDKIELPHVR